MPTANRTCTVDGCAEPQSALGKCKRHYLQDYYRQTKERDKAKRHAHYEANADTYKARAKISGAIARRADPEKHRERNRLYRQGNLDKGRAKQRVRLERIAAADTRIILDSEWRRLLARYNHRCAYCGDAAELTQDHVIPFARGGRHSIGNVLPACLPCNTSKGTKFLVEWRQYRRLIESLL